MKKTKSDWHNPYTYIWLSCLCLTLTFCIKLWQASDRMAYYNLRCSQGEQVSVWYALTHELPDPYRIRPIQP